MLEKRHRAGISFMEWLRVGALVGVVTTLVAWAGIAALSHVWPDPLKQDIPAGAPIERQLEE